MYTKIDHGCTWGVYSMPILQVKSAALIRLVMNSDIIIVISELLIYFFDPNRPPEGYVRHLNASFKTNLCYLNPFCLCSLKVYFIKT